MTESPYTYRLIPQYLSVDSPPSPLVAYKPRDKKIKEMWRRIKWKWEQARLIFLGSLNRELMGKLQWKFCYSSLRYRWNGPTPTAMILPDPGFPSIRWRNDQCKTQVYPTNQLYQQHAYIVNTYTNHVLLKKLDRSIKHILIGACRYIAYI